MRPTRRTRRIFACAVLLVLGLGPFLAIVGGGLYLRSPLHHRAVEARLTDLLGLTTRIGQVIPLGLTEFELRDVEIFMPPKAAGAAADPYDPALRTASCRKAQWLKNDATGQFELTLTDCSLDLTCASSAKCDLRLLEKWLQHDFAALNVHRVGVYRSSLRWGRGDFAILLDDISGIIELPSGGSEAGGQARLSAGQLNGQPANLILDVTLNPIKDVLASGDARELVRQFTLRTSPNSARPLPIALLGLDKLIGQPDMPGGLVRPIASGTFSGTLTYQAHDGDHHHRFTVEDAELTGLDLAELAPPLAGQINLKARRAQFELVNPAGSSWQMCLTRLECSGSLVNFDLASAMKLAGQPPCRGKVNLQIDYADLEPGKPLGEVRLAGDATGLDLAQLSALLADRFHGGQLRGAAKLSNVKLAVKNGKLDLAQAELVGPDGDIGSPTVDAKPTVDLKLIRAIAPDNGIDRLSPPDRIGYRKLKLGVSCTAASGLTLQGLGGDEGKAVMTIFFENGLPDLVRRLGNLPKTSFVNLPAPEKALDISSYLRFLAQPVPPISLLPVSPAVQQAARGR